MGDKGKFELMALDKAQVVHEVNAAGGEIAESLVMSGKSP